MFIFLFLTLMSKKKLIGFKGCEKDIDLKKRASLNIARTSDPLAKFNLKSERVNLVAPASPIHRARYSTNWDRKD